ncbi:MAG: RidA family protein [Phycisphaerales bacterium]|nr:MAG: RidA family protein [Phycisphaerales bacterium]
MKPSERLASLDMELPAVAAPVANYVPAIRTGNWVLTSGQIPTRDGKLVHVGKVPNDVSVDGATEAASICILNAVAAAAQAAGGIDNITRVIRVGVFVCSGPGFTEQPKVANGASDLLVKIFGDAGRHVRAAVGVPELPLNAAVEVDLQVEVSGA